MDSSILKAITTPTSTGSYAENNNVTSAYMMDATLDSCCQREYESNKKYNQLQRTLRQHDIIAEKERRKFNLVNIHTTTFEQQQHQEESSSSYLGCRCTYDPQKDTSTYSSNEYDALRILYEEKNRLFFNHNNKNNVNNNDDDEDDNDKQENKQQLDSFPPTNMDEKDDHNDSDDEYDYLLDEFDDDINQQPQQQQVLLLEEQRRAELEYAILQSDVAKQHGYGVHRYIHPRRVLRVAGIVVQSKTTKTTTTSSSHSSSLPPSPPAVVIHLYDPNSYESASLDWYLEQVLLSSTSIHGRGTIFLRSPGREVVQYESQILLPKHDQQQQSKHLTLQSVDDLPALLVVRDGQIVNVCRKLQGLVQDRKYNNHENDDQCSGGEIVPEAVYEWLDRNHALLSTIPNLDWVCRIRPEEEALLNSMARLGTTNTNSKNNTEPPLFRCGVTNCSKTYYHEHVGIQTEEQRGLVVPANQIILPPAPVSPPPTDNNNNNPLEATVE